MQRSIHTTAGALLAPALLMATFAGAAAQQDTTHIPPGVELETRYSVSGRRAVAVRPFAGPIPLAGVVGQVGAIVTQDLSLSDRYDMLPVPTDLATPGPVDYQAWNSLNLEYLVTGEVTPTADGFLFDVTVHDVVFAREHRRRTFTLPATTSPDFRMSVHGVSDEIVQWISEQPGIAATRIAFSRFNADQTYDLLIVDSDGENLRRILGGPSQLHSPVWSPDGQRIAYTTSESEGWKLVERDLVTGRSTTLSTGSQLFLTPAYGPDGSRVAYSVWLPGGLELMETASGQAGATPKRLTNTGGDNLAPTYSSDGRRIAFLSTRTGQEHIFVSNADGSGARQLTPPGRGVEFHGPDWSPTGTQVVFHGSAGGPYQIMVGDADRPGLQIRQLTSTGWNEDPSWAPDGRHIVYTGSGAQGAGLYVIDTVTGTIRLLTRGAKLREADWSSSMAARQ